MNSDFLPPPLYTLDLALSDYYQTARNCSLVRKIVWCISWAKALYKRVLKSNSAAAMMCGLYTFHDLSHTALRIFIFHQCGAFAAYLRRTWPNDFRRLSGLRLKKLFKWCKIRAIWWIYQPNSVNYFGLKKTVSDLALSWRNTTPFLLSFLCFFFFWRACVSPVWNSSSLPDPTVPQHHIVCRQLRLQSRLWRGTDLWP